MRVAVYDDQVYRRSDQSVWSERTLPLFVAEVGRSVDELVLLGRLDPQPGDWNFRLPEDLEFVPLPYYTSLSPHPRVWRALARSLRQVWLVLGRVDVVWALGPHPLSIVIVAIATLRRRRVVLGVRQEMRTYIRSRHPGRRMFHILGDLLEGAWRLIARRVSVVAVGPRIARQYGNARRVLPLYVSLVRERDLAGPDATADRSYDGSLQLLTVGRIDAEKNPLLLAEILARLDRRWRLVVCGTGPMEGALRERLRDLGVEDRAELRGYLPVDGGLLALYRQSHAFLHVSWTEGVPQVLFEAFASRLPVVATAVGGVAEATGERAALLIPPGTAGAAVDALGEIAAKEETRRRLVEAGAERVRELTMEVQARRVAAFLEAV